MITRIIGDVHAEWNSYLKLIKDTDNEFDNSVQVGDFGVGFLPPQRTEEMNHFLENSSKNHRFIRGNHDNPEICKTQMNGYIPDGTVDNDIMYIGGAWSIDWQYRTPGVDWWRDEECSYEELSKFIAIYENIQPRVMITHDCPTTTAYHMFVKNGTSIGGKSLHLTRTGEAFQRMIEIHQPELWIYGHWHHSCSMKIDNTFFVCLDELDYIDVDLKDSSKAIETIEKKIKEVK